MERIIEVMTRDIDKSKRIYTYIGKFAPYSIGLTIGEIMQGLPDYDTVRTCLADIMATLAEYEDEMEKGRLVYLPFSSEGLFAVTGKHITQTLIDSKTGQKFEASGKICFFKCSKEEAERHDEHANEFIKNYKGDEVYEQDQDRLV